MPIRFPCPHCQQKLSISSKRAGTTATCPRCQKEITVPTVEQVASRLVVTAKEAASSPLPDDESDDNPYSQFAVFDDTELVYDKGSSAAPTPHPARGLDRRLSVPRYVVLTQGLLLGGVALAAFALGLLTGGNFFSQSQRLAGQPCKVDGMISYASGNRTLPDAGAVVIFLPQTKDPGKRVPSEGLRPEEPLPDAPLRAAQEIRNLGGAYSRADEQGRFEVQLADPGMYYVLVLSSHVRRQPGQDVHNQDLVKIERFLERSSDLLADSRYQFTTETVRGDRKFNAVFD